VTIEILVLFKGKVPSKAALTRCFKELGFPLAFAPDAGALGQHEGYLPMRLRGEESGVEFDTYATRDEIQEDLEIDIDPRFTRGANFRWSSDVDESVVAYCFAGALARLVNGLVLDVDGETMLTADETIARARKDLKDTIPPPMQRGTRPTDIRRYLKCLLEQRSDLALVGRYLFVRPVRHLLRCAVLDRTSNRYEFRLWRSCKPLYAPNGSVADILHDGSFTVWQPHFEPLLMATLAEDVFEPLGRIATLTDFSSQPGGSTPFLFAHVTSLVLAGESERAAALVEEIRRKYEHLATEMQSHWGHISADIERTCAECHEKEAETVKAMKLERFWEPSPFPVELPAAERPPRSDEPLFVTAPWPAPPSWLWQELPKAPGSVRYAKDVLYRGQDIALLVALTPAEANERHRMRESYVLAARLPDGLLALVRRSTLYDGNSPEDSRTKPYEPYLSISLHGQTHVAHTEVSELDRAAGTCQITRFDIHDRATFRAWDCDLDLKNGAKTIWDGRTGERTYSKSALTDAEREAAACPIPDFGEYIAAVERFRDVLRVTGFGVVS
jgi:hypothetical protein